jgi:hypothetical protein
MSKRLTLICVLAVALALCVPAYAEVQNVKVSGDMTIRGIYRDNYDLDKDDTTPNAAAGLPTPGNNPEEYFTQAVGINVDADLTDNVSTAVRLVNQRDWDNNSSGAATFDVDVDLAYITLKEMVYQPLTLTIGRQDLWFGRGLIVGTNIPAPDVNANAAPDYNASINAHEYSETTGFDAIKATLDLAPWKLDLAYIKEDENVISANDDVDVYGANLGYKFDVYNAEAEAYYFGKIDKSHPTDNGDARGVDNNKVHTFGLRGSLEPISNLTIGAEGALQGGRYADTNTPGKGRKRDAYMLDAFGKYNFADVTWKPTLGVEWLMLSGEKAVNAGAGNSPDYEGWDAMYRGNFMTAIRDFQNYLYATRVRMASTQTVWDQDSGMSNQNSLLVKGSVVPMEDLTVEGTYGHFWLNEKINDANRGALNSSDDVGDELDLLLTYDYTEDVSFGLLTGWFFPGSLYPTGRDDTATDVVGTMKVVF